MWCSLPCRIRLKGSTQFEYLSAVVGVTGLLQMIPRQPVPVGFPAKQGPPPSTDIEALASWNLSSLKLRYHLRNDAWNSDTSLSPGLAKRQSKRWNATNKPHTAILHKRTSFH